MIPPSNESLQPRVVFLRQSSLHLLSSASLAPEPEAWEEDAPAVQWTRLCALGHAARPLGACVLTCERGR